MSTKGFAPIFIIIIAAAVIGGGAFLFFQKGDKPTQEQFKDVIDSDVELQGPSRGSEAEADDRKLIGLKEYNSTKQYEVGDVKAVPPTVQQRGSNEPPLLIKSIGVNFEDFVFTKEKLHFNRLFMGYGFFIPQSSASPDKYNPQPTFILPLGTPVRSLVDGIVTSMPTLWSGDSLST